MLYLIIGNFVTSLRVADKKRLSGGSGGSLPENILQTFDFLAPDDNADEEDGDDGDVDDIRHGEDEADVREINKMGTIIKKKKVG